MIYKYLIIAGAALVVASGIWFHGNMSGKQSAAIEAAKAFAAQIKERNATNEEVNNTDIADLCIELGGDPVACRLQDNGNN